MLTEQNDKIINALISELALIQDAAANAMKDFLSGLQSTGLDTTLEAIYTAAIAATKKLKADNAEVARKLFNARQIYQSKLGALEAQAEVASNNDDNDDYASDNDSSSYKSASSNSSPINVVAQIVEPSPIVTHTTLTTPAANTTTATTTAATATTTATTATTTAANTTAATTTAATTTAATTTAATTTAATTAPTVDSLDDLANYLRDHLHHEAVKKAVVAHKAAGLTADTIKKNRNNAWIRAIFRQNPEFQAAIQAIKNGTNTTAPVIPEANVVTTIPTHQSTADTVTAPIVTVTTTTTTTTQPPVIEVVMNEADQQEAILLIQELLDLESKIDAAQKAVTNNNGNVSIQDLTTLQSIMKTAQDTATKLADLTGDESSELARIREELAAVTLELAEAEAQTQTNATTNPPAPQTVVVTTTQTPGSDVVVTTTPANTTQTQTQPTVATTIAGKKRFGTKNGGTEAAPVVNGTPTATDVNTTNLLATTPAAIVITAPTTVTVTTANNAAAANNNNNNNNNNNGNATTATPVKKRFGTKN